MTQRSKQGRASACGHEIHRNRRHFAAKGVYVDLIKLYGSMELGPLVGLGDAIVDLVSTGALRANNLVEVEHVCDISSPDCQQSLTQTQNPRLRH